MDLGRQILSDVVMHSKYFRYRDDLNRRETFNEMVDRRMEMDIRKFPSLENEIRNTYDGFVRTKKVFPSMRSFQFAGKAIETTASRMFNCCYLPVNDVHAFSETMFLLLGGSGVGYSVQEHHVAMLPTIKATKRPRKYLIQDSIEGWADAVKVLMRGFFEGNSLPRFDASAIRKKGARLITSGGKAPGPEPLMLCLSHIQAILERVEVGTRLTTIQCHDILCHLAEAVYAGGIRRAAMISFFSPDDMDMLYAKTGDWYDHSPQRSRANNSAVLIRGGVSQATFLKIMHIQSISGSGEPGIYWTDDVEILSNPCSEASLRAFSFCNLSEINCAIIRDQKSFNEAARAAAFIGTLQASYTDFHYLRDVWRERTEEDALIGVGLTGIATDTFLALDFEEAARVVKETNQEFAQLIGTNSAARTTLIKPSGTTSSVLGCSSGVHDWHDRFYVRRIRIGKHEPIWPYLNVWIPDCLVDDVTKPHQQSVLEIPIKAPLDAIIRTDNNALDLLEREKSLYEKWVKPGHDRGTNTHSISITVSYRPEEYDGIIDWMWENQNFYAGISLLPYDGTVYQQMPFESISEEEYRRRLSLLSAIYLESVEENEDATDLSGEAACAGGACSL